MKIVTDSGEIECLEEKDMENIIINSSLKPYDDIWISKEQEYPCLAIMINGNLTCVHYFLNDNGDMWQSAGNYDKNVLFVAGGVETEMPGEAVILIEKAIECARQFWNSCEKPTCIEWRKL